MSLRLSSLCLALGLIHGSGGGWHDDGHGSGQTGAVCPDQETLSWDNFGEGFMTTYCTSCHDSTLTGSARQGAPVGVDYDQLELVQADADRIDLHAAAGPDSVNTLMPPPFNSDIPSLEEREQLGEWLACGAP